MAKTAKVCLDRRPRPRVGEVASLFCVGFGLTNGRPGPNGAHQERRHMPRGLGGYLAAHSCP